MKYWEDAPPREFSLRGPQRDAGTGAGHAPDDSRCHRAPPPGRSTPGTNQVGGIMPPTWNTGQPNYGLRPTAAYTEDSSGFSPTSSGDSGRHCGVNTTPGSTSSKPSNRAVTCALVRAVTGF